MTIFRRTGVRSSSYGTPTVFVAETLPRFFPGATEMSFACLARLRQLDVTASGQWIATRTEIVGDASGWGVSPADGLLPNWFLFGFTGTGVGQNLGLSRTFVAGDEGKVHFVCGSLSVTRTEIRVFTNGLDDGTPDLTTAAFAPSADAAVGSVLGSVAAPGAGLISWDMIDLGLLSGYAMTADDAAEMCKVVRATGQVPTQPPGGSGWYHLFRAERLLGHSGVWDAGGLSEGRGFLCEAGGNPSTPVLTSIQIGPNDWGGF